MVPPDRRSSHHLEVLVKATSKLPYFMELLKETRFQDEHLHEKLCGRLIHVDESKGKPIIKRSNFEIIDR